LDCELSAARYFTPSTGWPKTKHQLAGRPASWGLVMNEITEMSQMNERNETHETNDMNEMKEINNMKDMR